MLARWESTLVRLEADPMSLSRELDWVAKLAILEGYRERDGLDWSSPRLQLVDLQYSDVRPDKGLYNRLVATGRFDRLVTEDEVERRHDRAAGRHPGLLPRPLPGEVRRRGVAPPAGTRSSSTSAASRCSGCRRWSRCAAPRLTSATCSTDATRPSSYSMLWQAVS